MESRTDGALKLWPTTLYGALADLTERGFVVEDDDGSEPEDNLGRIRYRLTAAQAARAARPSMA